MHIKKLLLLFVVLFACVKLPAQLCQGSLGDPIVNITFGAGANPGRQLSTTTNLQYIGSDCPNDGSYTVRNATSRCFGNTWHTLNSDHTGDPNGYFMLINASLQKSEFYIDTVRGLCPGTTYEFASWVMNVIIPSSCSGNTIPPNLTFNIERTDGTVVETYSTGNIAASGGAQWKQYGFFFKTPVNVSDVVLRIINNSQGGCGNDLAIDDITFRSCGPKLTAAFGGGITGTIKEVCEGAGGDVILTSQVSAGFSNPSFQWQQSSGINDTWTDIPGANSTALTRSFTAFTPAGDYLYRIITAEAGNIRSPACRVASAPLTVRVNGKPSAAASNNGAVCEGNTITLTAQEGAQYTWTGVNGYSASGPSVTIPNAKLNNAGKYYVNITTAAGCKAVDSITVAVKPAPVAATGFSSAVICTGQSVTLSSSGGDTYRWSPANGLSNPNISGPVANPADTTTYTVVVSNSFSCSDSASVTVNVLAVPRADAGPDHEILEGQSVQLPGVVTGSNNRYSWSPNTAISNVQALQPVVNPVVDTRYILSVTSNNGCGSFSDTTVVYVYKKVIIPNAFSPNGDGVNDTWKITALNTYSDYDLMVFNRYGQLVYQSKNYSTSWNGTYSGKPLPVGTYYYLVDLKKKLLPKLTGYVVILR